MHENNVKSIKTWQIILPVALGLVAVGWLFSDEFNAEAFASFRFTLRSMVCIAGAFLLMAVRDGAMMVRFRLFTDNVLTWRQVFTVNVLSEFTTAVTPMAVGGSSLLVFFLRKEGISTGKSTVITLVNLFLDELYFVLLIPVLFAVLPLTLLFPPSMSLVSSMLYVFAGLYFVRLLWSGVLFAGVFVCPHEISRLMIALFRLPLLRRWHARAENVSERMLQASHDIKRYPVSFWLKVFFLTLIAWTARFMVVNLLFWAWLPMNNSLTVFARQLVIWVFIAMLPTPGGSGASEWMFKDYYGDFITQGSLLVAITILWRVLTYYMYLILGILVTPKWICKPRIK